MDDSRRQWGALLLLLAVGVILRWPAVYSGLHMDDYAQWAMVDGAYPVPRAPWDLFSFTRGAAENPTLMSRGSLPWWSDPELRLSALRPLSSLLIWFDVRVLGADAVAMHLHSMLWWCTAVVAAFVAVRRRTGPVVALVAIGMYALDDAHAFPVTWLANRSALVSATFGFLALAAHDRFRAIGAPRSRGASMALMAACLAAGEYGLCAAAFIFAYELRSPERWSARLRAVAPTLVVVAVYLVAHRVGAFGSEHSAVYVDPVREPIAFAGALAERLPVLLADVLLAIPLAQVLLVPGLAVHGAIVALLAVAPVIGLLLMARRRCEAAVRRDLDRWALGGLLALVPVCASFVSGRLTVIAALGGHVFLATWIVGALRRVRDEPGAATRARAAPAAVVAMLHLVGAPLWSRLETDTIIRLNRGGEHAALQLRVDEARVPSQHFVVLTVTDPMMLIYPPWIRWAHGKPLPARYTVLSMAPHVHRMTRVADDALELEVEDGAMLRGPVEQLFARPARRPRPGQPIALDGVTIDVRAVAPDGAPTRVRYTFDRALGDPGLAFFIMSPRGLLPYPIGPVGSTVVVAPGAHPLTIAPAESGDAPS